MFSARHFDMSLTRTAEFVGAIGEELFSLLAWAELDPDGNTSCA